MSIQKKDILLCRQTERHNPTVEWCNGSTRDSGPLCLGSSPSSTTNKERSFYSVLFIKGGLAEWSMAAVLKTVVRQRTGGSNPSASAKKQKRRSAKADLLL